MQPDPLRIGRVTFGPADTKRLRKHLETFADAAALPSQHFIRCSCGACVRNDQQECPICGEALPSD